MERYNDYKDSGVAYINEIPAKWILTRNKYLAEIKGRIGFKGYTKNDFVDKGKGALVIGATEMTVEGKILIKNPQFISWFKYYESPEIMLEKGHILIVQRGSTVGKVSYVDKYLGKATINPSLVLLKNIKLVPKYYLYYLMSSTLQSYIKAETSTTAIPMITQTQIGNYFILIPPLKEQTVIANYLDTKTTAIDKKIKLLKQKIKHYKAYRKTLINETVTKGLDKSVKLKDSGIDWIGEIPEHWEVHRLKSILRKKITDGPHETPEFTNVGYPFISVDGIQNGELTFDGCRYISEFDFKRYSKKVKIEMNDIFMGKSASTGKIARVKVDFPFTVWSPIAVIKVLNSINPAFIEYFLKSDKVQIQIDFLGTYNTQKNIAMKDIPRIMLVIPPTQKEQQQIAVYLDTKTSTIDSIVNNIETQITTLKELRKTLINEVVTGKVKVTA